MPRIWPVLLALSFLAAIANADGPADNSIANVRPVPPKGIEVPEADRQTLREGLQRLANEIEGLRSSLKDRPRLLGLLPDVQIFHRAVASALEHGEFFNAKDLDAARTLLQQGLDRAKELGEGKPSWETATGLVVRGYVSRIDGSVQPYGLVVPESYAAKSPNRFRLDVWCHGRGENLSEVNFLRERQASRGEFTPANAFVLHPYGRYCNANRFAGEVDLFEALEDVAKHYPIDEDRLVMRGFSMGGAACWQFAVHYPDRWVATAPGAGFSETAEFLRVFQNEKVQPTWFEQKLWHLYDSTDYAANLFNCPTVAYSGEKDRQKQAADLMARALEEEGIDMVHVIGANAGHNYTPDARAEINRRIDLITEKGRDPLPERVHFTTWTLRYNRAFWLRIDGLERHWERARVDGTLQGNRGEGPLLRTSNVSRLTLEVPPGYCPLDVRHTPKVMIDGDEIKAPRPRSDRSWLAHFARVDGHWTLTETDDDGRLVKRHGLQGPIDDAFMDSFLMVRPTGQAAHEKVQAWTAAEMSHAIDHWRKQFRGDARVKDDRDVNDADIASHNLILWGDPSSNAVLARIADKLPIGWDKERIKIRDASYASGHHVPALIYPNPLNPGRYIVLNSGFTFREYDYLNNARQVPKLPDFAVIDIDSPVTSKSPGAVVDEGFFDEEWKLPSERQAEK